MNTQLGSLAFLPGGSEWIVLLLLILLLFGAKRLPELSRSLGKGMSEFKKAMHAATSEIEKIKEDVETAATSNPEPKKIAPPDAQNPKPDGDGPAKA